MLLVRGTKKHVLWFVGVGGWGILLEVVGWMTDWSCCILGCFPAPYSMRGVATDAVGSSGSSLSLQQTAALTSPLFHQADQDHPGHHLHLLLHEEYLEQKLL